MSKSSTIAICAVSLILFLSKAPPPPDLPLPHLTPDQLKNYPNYQVKGKYIYDKDSIVAVLVK